MAHIYNHSHQKAAKAKGLPWDEIRIKGAVGCYSFEGKGILEVRSQGITHIKQHTSHKRFTEEILEGGDTSVSPRSSKNWAGGRLCIKFLRSGAFQVAWFGAFLLCGVGLGLHHLKELGPAVMVFCGTARHSLAVSRRSSGAGPGHFQLKGLKKRGSSS